MAIKVNLMDGAIWTLWVDIWLVPSAEKCGEASYEVNQCRNLFGRRPCGQFRLPPGQIFVRRGRNIDRTGYIGFCHDLEILSY